MDAFESLVEAGAEEEEPRAIIAAALGELDIPSVAEASLSRRADLVRLRAQLEAIRSIAASRVAAIDRAFLEAARKEGADLVRTGAGDVTLELPAATYHAQPDRMRDALMALVPTGVISKEQVDAALQVIITVKPNHSKLNALARHNGMRVQEAIESNRRKVPPDRLAARPKYPRGEGS